MSYIQMQQRGAWWKGLTKDGIEVAVSDAFFKQIKASQEKNQAEHPALVAAVQAHYDRQMVCLHPQWWVDCFLYTNYGIGPLRQLKWVRKGKRYHKLMLGQVTHNGYSSNEVGSEGTLIFRKLPVKEEQRVRSFHDMIAAMRGFVEAEIPRLTGATVKWE